MSIKQIKQTIRETKQEMKARGIKKTSCFNGGLDSQTYSFNARLFRLQTELEGLESKARREDGPEYDFWKEMSK